MHTKQFQTMCLQALIKIIFFIGIAGERKTMDCRSVNVIDLIEKKEEEKPISQNQYKFLYPLFEKGRLIFGRTVSS